MSSFFIYYNHLGDTQVVEGMTEYFARTMLNMTGQINHIKMQKRPTMLEVASVVHTGNVKLAEVAIAAYEATDSSKKPIIRAKAAFKKAFGEAADTKNRTYEAEALTDIVQGAIETQQPNATPDVAATEENEEDADHTVDPADSDILPDTAGTQQQQDEPTKPVGADV